MIPDYDIATMRDLSQEQKFHDIETILQSIKLKMPIVVKTKDLNQKLVAVFHQMKCKTQYFTVDWTDTSFWMDPCCQSCSLQNLIGQLPLSHAIFHQVICFCVVRLWLLKAVINNGANWQRFAIAGCRMVWKQKQNWMATS